MSEGYEVPLSYRGDRLSVQYSYYEYISNNTAILLIDYCCTMLIRIVFVMYSMWVYTYGHHIQHNREWINRVRLPILLAVSCAGNISLSPFAPENLVSRDGFGRPVPRQPAYCPHLLIGLNLVYN